MNILVAGLTGQLGVGLLEARERREVDLTAVVRRMRGRDPRRWLAFRFPDCPDLALDVRLGDVTQSQWGLSEEDLRELAPRVDVVLNLAAETNWAAPEHTLHRTNAVGAANGLQLAQMLYTLRGRCRLYCHVGSIYVAGSRTGWISEQPLGPDGYRTAYEHSKWLGEQMLMHDAGALPEVSVAIVRVGTLLGNSQTGETVHRNALYMLADLASKLTAGLIPTAPRGRIDALPRDVAGAYLLRSVCAAHERMLTKPAIYHLCAGETAPTLRSLLAAARSCDPDERLAPMRPVDVSTRSLLWLSQNIGRFATGNGQTLNALMGLRYLGLDRIFERSRLAMLLGENLPAVSTELLARLVFDLRDADSQPYRSLSPLARFAG